MKKYFLMVKLPHMVYILPMLLISLSIALSSCTATRKTGDEKFAKNDSTRIEWNILFDSGTSAPIRNDLVDKVQNYISNYYSDHGFNTQLYSIITCPCDPYLYNISFSPIDGAGESVVPPPPSTTLPGSGDYIDIKSIAVNLPIDNIDQRTLKDIKVHKVKNIGIDTSKILAIIDSGIDTALFSRDQGFFDLMWKDPSGSTIYNFLPSQSVDDFFDGTDSHHGSAVASIALKAMDGGERYSKLMILKALDKENKGSIFSVSCALSYAIQKRANVINLSLGYYGQEGDSILYHYLKLANDENPDVQIFAAAGNTPGMHNPDSICDVVNPTNELHGDSLFYPACFQPELEHLISVTQIAKPGRPCFYQNYSNKYISLGVINSNNCCALPSGFTGPDLYEGSSFATPVASGLRMKTMLKAGTTFDSENLWKDLIKRTPGNTTTVGGKYIIYNPNFPQQ